MVFGKGHSNGRGPFPGQVFEGRVVEGDPNTCGHVICTQAGSGPNKQTISYATERVVGNGSFGVVFQATCLETRETVRTEAAMPIFFFIEGFPCIKTRGTARADAAMSSFLLRISNSPLAL